MFRFKKKVSQAKLIAMILTEQVMESNEKLPKEKGLPQIFESNSVDVEYNNI